MSEAITRLNAALEGRYRIEAELGEGGMATVYLADDIKHERKVALKVLKPELAAVVGAERFLAEIKTTANLTHPHILPLFDSGEADGFVFYVMPHVEGESLREKLDREHQLPVDDAVRIASDVAEALDYAHGRGVIHRDIKPANILIQAGRPVIADFGIALAVSAGGADRLTETGLSVGTPQYMSPEQATGDQTTGPPTDTYALGCVLYEMLVGEPPYTGATAQAILGRIITGGPASATEQRSAVPAHVDGAIRKALEKLPADRFTSARGFADALADEHFRHGELAKVAAPSRVGPWKRLTIGMSAVATAFALAFGWSFLGPEPPAPVVRFAFTFEEGQEWTTQRGAIGLPDGSGIVYVGPGETGAGSRQLWIRRWTDLDAQPIRGTEGAWGFAFSPDGREIAFSGDPFAWDPLQVVPLEGGLSRTLVDAVNLVWDWTTDGVYFSGVTFGLERVPATGGGIGAVEVVTELRQGEIWHNYFNALPGGTMAMFVSVGDFQGKDAEIWALDLVTGDRRPLTLGLTPRYASSGHLLFNTLEGFLMAAPFDPVTAELSGPPVPVVEGLTVDHWGFTYYAVDEDGTLIYQVDVEAADVGSDSEMVWVSRSGVETPVDPDWQFRNPILFAGWSLSPDGSRVAYTVVHEEGVQSIWVKQLPDGPAERLTFSEGREMSPAWSGDGEFLAYIRAEANVDYNVWQTRADGTGVPRLLLDPDVNVLQLRRSPDGEWLLLRTGVTGGTQGRRDVMGFRPGTDEALIPLVVSEDSDQMAPALSPGGRWLTYSSDETGRREIYVRPFPIDDSPPILVSRVGGSNPVWAHSSEELFYIDADFGMVAVQVETGADFRVLQRETLFRIPTGSRGLPRRTAYDLSPDDQRFLMVRALPSTGGATRTIVVQNFFEVLKARVGN